MPLSTPSAHLLEHGDALESTIYTFSCEYPIFILTVLISSPLLDEIFVEDLSTHWFIKCSAIFSIYIGTEVSGIVGTVVRIPTEK